MHAFVRNGLLALVALGLLVAVAPAQTPPATKGAAPAAGTAPAVPADLKQVLATVNGEPITKGDVMDFVVRYQVPVGDPEQHEGIYRTCIDTLVNMKLVSQFIARQRLPVSDERVDADIENLKNELKKDGEDLATALLRNGKSMDDLRKELANRQRWIEYVRLKGTDAELKKYVDNNKDIFNGAKVKASHILLAVKENASAAEKEQVRQRLLQIKRDIEAGKITFAEAANKFSEDDRKAKGDGGDIGYFERRSGIVEEFADAAFKLKKGAVSNPVETLLGYHLILVTDRTDGTPFDFEAKKKFVYDMYSMELQKSLVETELAKAKVDIKPLPANLFPTAPAATEPAKGAATPKGAAAKP
ncbi:MAG: peptidylprolyl isomerase [Isosphaeraceae bacterium]|nr:peptidylprolyl isomerase [Isosphaeraceae bacterium]